MTPPIAGMPTGRGYLEYLPAGYSTSTELYPCIIFLHGSGERGDGSPTALGKVTNQGIPKNIKLGSKMCFTVNGKTECFVVLSPQTNDWFWKNNDGTTDVMPFVKWALQNYRIDPDRIFLTGLSMGGEGAWYGASYADNEPNYFAAIAPTAARADNSDGCNVANKKIPVWAFHGDADTANPLNTGFRPIQGMATCNASIPPIWTVYAGANHGQTWAKAYTESHVYHNPNMYEWFLAQKRIPTIKPPTTNAGVDIQITLPTNFVTLAGTASDADGSITGVVWKQLTGPNVATFSSANVLTPDLTNLKKGTYNFSLTSTDNQGLSTTDLVYVQVNPATGPTPPTANAGVDKTITLPTNTLAITGSGTDADGTISTYQWTQDSGPNTATLAGAGTKTLTASNLVVGAYTFSLLVTDNSGLTGSDQMVLTVLAAPPNVPPVANAGSDKTITLPTNSVSLVGTGTDSDGTITSYQWVQSSGPSASTITSPTAASTTITSLLQGVYVFTLTVTDNKASTGTDQVIITVLPVPPNSLPVAKAGTDISITLPINSSTLVGIGTDSDGTIASYQWVQTSGPNTSTIATPTSASTAIGNLIVGNYLFTLTVTDDKGGQGSDQILVTVLPLPPNQPPVANAGANVSITLPINSVSLSGNGTDSDGTIAQYLWTQQNGPSTATIVSPGLKNTQINNLIEGVYTFELEVTDNTGAKGSDQIVVTVFPPANIAPTANAGTDASITLPINSTSLTGVGTDSDGTIAGYLWEQVSGPSSATFSSTSTANTTASSLTSGIYIFSVTVTDNNGAKASDQVKITVLPQPPNQPPVANAGSDISLTLPTNTATFNGQGTDSDGTIVGYHWNYLSGPATINLSNVDLQSLTASNLVVGIYLFELVIVDDRGATATDQVKIFVDAPNLPPVSKAGSDKSITLPTNSILIVGSGTDADGTIVSYSWEQVSGPNTASITNPAISQITATGLMEGIYIFGLTVTDNDGITDYDDVRVIVNPAPPNNPPVAITGPDLDITLPINSVTIAGSGTDSDGTIASYLWSQVSGPNIAGSTNLNQAGITFSNLTDGVYVFRLLVTDNLGAKGQKDVNVRVNPQPVNVPPIANAGSDGQISLPVNSIILNGSGSDSDGTIASYQWTQINGPSSATFSTPLSGSTDATNLLEGIYVFRLTVKDDKGTTAFDEVTITVKPIPANLPPISNAGGNKIITLPTNSTSLTGSGSDQDGTISSYTWVQISGPTIATTSLLTQPTLNISNLVSGIYLFRLTVADNSGSTGFDEVNIRVQPVPANQPPTANAGGNKIITLPVNSSSFSGSGTDTDGTIASHSWIQISGASTATLTGILTPTLNAADLIEGTYIFRLTVTDNVGDSGFDDVNIRVNAALPNAPPVANAGVDLSITLPTNSKIIIGSGTDSDGTISTYDWTQPAGPNTAILAGNSTNSLTASSLIEGIYTFRLTVTDNLGVSAYDEVQLTVNAVPPNIPPVADAGLDQDIITPPATITLTGGASDTDGTIVSTQWTQVSGAGSSTISVPNSLTTNVSGLQIGTYVFSLQATDDKGDISIDEVTIFVKGNLNPVAFAGDTINLLSPITSTQLSGAGTDPDGNIVLYEWTQISGPSTASVSDPLIQSPSIASLSVGTYVFQLTVTDDKGGQDQDNVVVAVIDPVVNQAPIANAGEDIILTLPDNSVTLNGLGTDADGTITNYLWSQVPGPTIATLSDPSIQDLTISSLEKGIYLFSLTVTDNDGLTASDTVTVSVESQETNVSNFPKIFSPNGTPPNDTWVWKDISEFQGCNLEIFNRNGKKVFSMTSYDNSWDGKSSDGQVLEEEAYYYIIRCNGSKEITGGVRIVR